MATARAQSKQSRPAPKAKTSVTKSEKPLASTLEIVPGKFSEHDWYNLIESDETEDFIADILDDIWSQTSKQIEKIYISKQLLPYTTMMVKNALSNVIQWAFLERDEPEPAQGTFWIEDAEPVPSNMDNFGEGVVPACREEIQTLLSEPETTRIPSVRASISSASPTATKQTQQITENKQQNVSDEYLTSQTKLTPDDSILTEQSLSGQAELTMGGIEEQPEQQIEQRLHNHDVLVIQPTKLEPLAELFFPPSNSKVSDSNKKYKQTKQIKKSFTSSTVESQSITTKSSYHDTKKSDDKLRVFDDQHIEELINKAPAAAHSILKSILSRPPGYRELELDEFGNVASITKLDPDKLPSKSIRVKCDVIKPRKTVIDTRPVLNAQRQPKKERQQEKFQSIKLVVPEQSVDVGDLIQPVPGVLYEDRRLKKGDPRRYQAGLSKYFGFHDAERPLRPIANRFDVMLSAKQILSVNNSDEDDDVEESSKIRAFRTL
ncbi:unnamed protein product, partial [Didymodactylos carnosus]